MDPGLTLQVRSVLSLGILLYDRNADWKRFNEKKKWSLSFLVAGDAKEDNREKDGQE